MDKQICGLRGGAKIAILNILNLAMHIVDFKLDTWRKFLMLEDFIKLNIGYKLLVGEIEVDG